MMFVEVNRTLLDPHLAHAAAVAAAVDKGGVPVLKMVRLSAADGALRIGANSLAMAWGSSVEAHVGKAGEVAVDARELADRIKALPEGAVRIEARAEGAKLRLKSLVAQRAFELRTAPVADLPVVSALKEPQAIAIDGVLLARLLGVVRHAVSPDLTRPNLSSVRLRIGDGRIEAAATDGHRLSLVEAPWAGEASLVVLLPRPALPEICALLAGATEATLEIEGSVARFAHAGSSFTTRLIEAQFPTTSKVIPEPTTQTWRAEVDREALASALKALRRWGSDSRLRLSTHAGDDGPLLHLHGWGKDSGDEPGDDDLPLVGVGPAEPLALAMPYLAEAVEALTCERVVLAGNGPLDAITVRPVGEALASIEVVMPMRL